MKNEPELYCSIVLDSYVKLIRERYRFSDAIVDDLMHHAGIENYELGDHSVWFTQSQVNRFHEKLSTLTDNLRIAKEAGRFAATPGCFGEVRAMVLSMGGVKNAFKQISKWIKRVNRSSTYTTQKIGRNKIEIKVTPNPGVQEMPFQCQNRQGSFKGIADLFYLKDFSMTHPECMFEGGASCRYILTWKESLFSILKRLVYVSGAFTVGVALLLLLGPDQLISVPLLTVSFIVFLMLALMAQYSRIAGLKQSLNDVYENKDELIRQMDVTHEHSRVIIDIIHALREKMQPPGSFNRVAEIAGKRLKYDRVMIMIANNDETELSYKGGYGFSPSEQEIVRKYRISLESPSKGIFYESFKYGKTILENDLETLQKKSTKRSFRLAEIMKPVSFLTCPIVVGEKTIGLIVAGHTETPIKVDGNDKHLMEGVAEQIGNFLERQSNEIERAKMQSHQTQLQKMEAIGVLAGGIAHDFNNILMPIIGYADLGVSLLGRDHEVSKYLNNIHKASIRARDLVKQILDFSRQGEKKLLKVRISSILKEALKLLRASLPSTIDVKTNIDATKAKVYADPTQIHQVIMNLCTNAYHAMADTGGTLSVSLCCESIDSGSLVENHFLEPGPYIRMTVSDTGHGIEPTIIDKIFDPYFSTKTKSDGTGLGLSITHRIVKGLGGHIAVNSTLGKGTRFDIYFPETTEKTSFDIGRNSGIEPALEGKGHIMVIDDEKPITSLLETALSKLGYKISSYNSGEKALDAFQKKGDEFDLVVTDMTLPKFTGTDLIQKLKSISPDVPVILCSGFGNTMDEKKASEIGADALMMKPVLVKDLAKNINMLLKNRKA